MMELGTKMLVLVVLAAVAAKASVLPAPVNVGPIHEVENVKYNEDSDLTVRQLIEKYGYRGETHIVETDDGYILEMHRITGPKGNSNPEGKEPVLLMHGILSSSNDWIITGPEKALGYALADEGYDVWLGNARGNTYARKHKEYTVLDKKFWNFSWHEIAIKDLPSMIDYILKKTNREKIIYAGHSQGTTSFFVMASELPKYQDKIKAMFALAPVAYLSNIQSFFYRVIAKASFSIKFIMNAFGYYEFQPTPEFVKKVMSTVCDNEAWTLPICSNVLFVIAGAGSDQLNSTILSAILGHVPAGSSVKQVVHYAQLINSKEFRQYDHGVIMNKIRYKQWTPPTYNLSKIETPVYLHYASADLFSNPRDVARLRNELGNVAGYFRVPHDKFGHLDFLWANDGRQLLYNKVIQQMEQYRD